MPTTSFTYSGADGLKIASAFKWKHAEDYAAALLANPNMTDEQFVKSATRLWWESIVREAKAEQADAAARVAAEADVAAAVAAAVATAGITVT